MFVAIRPMDSIVAEKPRDALRYHRRVVKPAFHDAGTDSDTPTSIRPTRAIS